MNRLCNSYMKFNLLLQMSQNCKSHLSKTVDLYTKQNEVQKKLQRKMLQSFKLVLFCWNLGESLDCAIFSWSRQD